MLYVKALINAAITNPSEYINFQTIGIVLDNSNITQATEDNSEYKSSSNTPSTSNRVHAVITVTSIDNNMQPDSVKRTTYAMCSGMVCTLYMNHIYVNFNY